MAKRRVYLDNLPLEEAQERYQEVLNQRNIGTKIERIPVQDAAGRVTDRAVHAVISSPHYHASAMDGVAVRAEETYGATETKPVHLKINQQAIEVDTGDPLPEGCNAVIMVEHLHYIDEETVEIIQPVAPWQHIRTLGEDMVSGEMIVVARHKLSAVDIGALLAGGVLEIEVFSRVNMAILPTGTELVLPGSSLKTGDIIEYNGSMLASAAREWEAIPHVLEPTVDDYELLKSKIKDAANNHDVVVINAGSSAGREDFTADIIRELGEVIVHGVAIKPGKPVILGVIENTPVVGIPGYPVSAYLTFELFVKPLVYRMQGLDTPEAPKIKANTAKKIVSPLGQEEFMRVKLGRIAEKIIATPISRGAGIITSMVKADGILRVPRLSEGFHPGQEVDVEILRDMGRIDKTLVITGSHDMCLDIIHNQMSRDGLAYLSSAHVGSTGGILAIRRGEAHGAGIHLLDPQTGEYNISYINKYLPNKKLVLMNLVYRQQGLIVPKGNPKNIKGISDLAGTDIIFVNRQAGAGTRILFDYYLGELGFTPEEINGYQREEFTHLGVAVAVASGTGHCGMGILAAAKALDLDFIPVAEERYDILISAEYWESPQINALKQVIASEEFLSEVANLGGYSTTNTGQIMWRN